MDETYVQDHHAEGREVLTVRGDEPWSWVKDYGQGRIFYTASGHDERFMPAGVPGPVDPIADWAAGEDAGGGAQGVACACVRNRSPWLGAQLRSVSTSLRPLPKALDPGAGASRVGGAGGIRGGFVRRGADGRQPDRDGLGCAPTPVGDRIAGLSQRRGARAQGRDRISILTDEDGDGRADKKQVFYEGLNLLTSLLVVPGGGVGHPGLDLLALLDEDGDDRCDSVRTGTFASARGIRTPGRRT
ncbi:MAG: hypothetical protein R3F17_09575 [Planctomycetota bacterium]